MPLTPRIKSTESPLPDLPAISSIAEKAWKSLEAWKLDVNAQTQTQTQSNALDTAALDSITATTLTTRSPLFVTLTYAQSLDGSISSSNSMKLRLSGNESLLMTHALRAIHDGIMVGIGTLLTDNSRLTVRRCIGADPIPIILDNQLRIPLDANIITGKPYVICLNDWEVNNQNHSHETSNGFHLIKSIESFYALLGDKANDPSISSSSKFAKSISLLEKGVRLILLRKHATETNYQRWQTVFNALAAAGMRSIMVEGGATIIQSLLQTLNESENEHPHLINQLILTIAPVYVGGYKAVNCLLANESTATFPRLKDVSYDKAGEDLLVHGFV